MSDKEKSSEVKPPKTESPKTEAPKMPTDRVERSGDSTFKRIL
jgi:hypothetical protein